MALGKRQKARLEKLWVTPSSGLYLKVSQLTLELHRRKGGTYPVVVSIMSAADGMLLYRTEVARAPLGDTKKIEEICDYLSQITEYWLDRWEASAG